MKSSFLVTLVLAITCLAAAQDRTKSAPAVHYLRCGALVQPESGKLQRNVLITIQGERITEVREGAPTPEHAKPARSGDPGAGAPSGAQVMDLSEHTCLPRLLD